jgi:hypothetical protein
MGRREKGKADVPPPNGAGKDAEISAQSTAKKAAVTPQRSIDKPASKGSMRFRPAPRAVMAKPKTDTATTNQDAICMRFPSAGVIAVVTLAALVVGVVLNSATKAGKALAREPFEYSVLYGASTVENPFSVALRAFDGLTFLYFCVHRNSRNEKTRRSGLVWGSELQKNS